MEPLSVEHYPLSPSKASVIPSKQIGMTLDAEIGNAINALWQIIEG
jgi:hypothetical protein